jgi:hypothetical protein
LLVKQDYYIKYYLGRSNTYRLDRTIVTVGAPRMLAMSTSPASAAPPLAPLRPLPLLQYQQLVQRSPALLRPPLLPQRQVWAPCSPEEQGLALYLHQKLFDSGGWAATPSGFPHRVPFAFIALISGLYRRQLLRSKESSSSTSELETRVLNYTTQDGLPLGTWSR